MCHAPIVIPTIAGERAAACRGTTTAMGQVAERLLATRPDLVVLVDPHAPRRRGAFGLQHGRTLAGDFGRFGCPEVAVSAAGSPRAALEVERQATKAGLRLFSLPEGALDHGAMVPLWFLRRAGLACPVLLMSLPYPGDQGHERMGRALAATGHALGERWALLASGDMSHRLLPDAPAGYDPRARAFDSAFVENVRTGDLAGACRPDGELQALAAEDVVDSCRVVASASGFDSQGCEVLHYEGPFGVGYLEAFLYHPSAEGTRLAK